MRCSHVANMLERCLVLLIITQVFEEGVICIVG